MLARYGDKLSLQGMKTQGALLALVQQRKTSTAQSQDGPKPPGHVQKRLTKKIHFLQSVAKSNQQASAARAGVRKKSRKPKQKALPDLSSLADLLADVDKQQQVQESRQKSAEQQLNPQKGRTEQIRGSKARRAVT